MQSITKSVLSDEQIVRMTRQAFGKNAELRAIDELTDGCFNNAYRIELTSGRKAVLKVAPRQAITVMRYEKNLMETEVRVLNQIYSQTVIPAPRVLFYDRSHAVVDNAYFFMEFIAGEPLNKSRDTLSDEHYRRIASQLGEYGKKINGIKGDYFGYFAQENKRFTTWGEAFLSMIRELLDDAQDAGVTLPYGNGALYGLVERYREVLNQVARPVLVHKDLWEGNIFVDPGQGKITGIVDWERALFGDALLELVCGFLLENQSFMEAYRGRAELDQDEFLRTLLYKVYLGLIMIIECQFRQYSDENAAEGPRSMLDAALEELEKW